MATRCLGEIFFYADEFTNALLSGGKAGDLSAANSGSEDSDFGRSHNPVCAGVVRTVAGWQEKGYDVDYFASALRWHVSTVTLSHRRFPRSG